MNRSAIKYAIYWLVSLAPFLIFLRRLLRPETQLNIQFIVCFLLSSRFFTGSFQVKSSKILIQPDIIDSDFLENLHSCYIP